MPFGPEQASEPDACMACGVLQHWHRILIVKPAGRATALMIRRFLVQGRVQGVGFRWFVHREAAALGLRGWVQNTEDGDVEVVAAGTHEELSALRSTLHRGSRGSRVDRVVEQDLADEEAQGLTSFQIEGAW